MEHWIEIVKIVSDVGVSIAIIGVVIYYLWKHFIHRNNTDDYELSRKKQVDINQDELTSRMIDTLISLIASKTEDQHFKEEPTNNYINHSIIEVMRNNLLESGGSRILHFSYHNGGKGYDGHSYQRMSCVNEVTKDNIFPIQNKYNNMFRTSMFYFYQQLNDRGFFDIYDIKDIEKEDPGTYQMLALDNVAATFGSKIVDKNGKIVGFIAICYDKPQSREQAEIIIPVLQKIIYQIEGVYLTLQGV